MSQIFVSNVYPYGSGQPGNDLLKTEEEGHVGLTVASAAALQTVQANQ